jgi:hypothetical protein
LSNAIDLNPRTVRLNKYDVIPSINHRANSINEFIDGGSLMSLASEVNLEPNVSESIMENLTSEQVNFHFL